MVPVLSNTMALMRWALSRLSASLIRIPISAPFPIPTMMAVGVASPKAHGQAIIRTVTAASNPWVNPLFPPKTIQSTKDSRAIPIIVGTKTAAIRSTSFWTGALLPCASCTRWMIWANKVSVPTLSAVNRKLPFWLMVPAKTEAPFSFSTGTGSPLSMLSST